MARSEERLSFSRFDWLKEIWCWIVKHDEHCVPAAATDDYAGTYCLRCGAHWNHAGNRPPAG